MSASETLNTSAQSVLLSHLAEISTQYPTERKLLLVPDVNYGRELLVALARSTGGWIGWEPTTLRRVADELTFVSLFQSKLRIPGDVELGLMVNRAFDLAVDNQNVKVFAKLGHSLGFRQAMHDTILELRLSGVSADQLLRDATVMNSKVGSGITEFIGSDEPLTGVSEIAAVLDVYESLLKNEQLADTASIFSMACSEFDHEFAHVFGDAIMFCAPTLKVQGLPGALLEKLVIQDARLLMHDCPVNVDIPDALLWKHKSFVTSTIPDASGNLLAWVGSPSMPESEAFATECTSIPSMFCAATPSDELREVFRRCVAQSIPWDQVEIVTTDVDTYGIALDVLCQNVGVGATMLHGIPLARTRLGRAIHRWFAWIENGLSADILRQALEAGELNLSPDIPSTSLAREFRKLAIGWGRERYLNAITLLGKEEYVSTVRAHEGESADEVAARIAFRRQLCAELATLLERIFQTLPPVPERGVQSAVRVSPSDIAKAALTWISLVPIHGHAEQQTADRIQSRLGQLAEFDSTPISFSGAIATVRDALSDVRAWPELSGIAKPWTSNGGKVHLTDIVHAGTTSRPHVFVVGLDAERTHGLRGQDPLLPDSVRKRFTQATLPTAAQRHDVNTFGLLASLAALRGNITFSYATSGTLDGREAGPSPALLQTLRLIRGEQRLSYKELRAELYPPVCAVPELDRVTTISTSTLSSSSLPSLSLSSQSQSAGLLDASDVWFDTIIDGPLLLNGEQLVRASYSGLGRGLHASDLANSPEIGPYHGVIPQAANLLTPTASPGKPVSPSALETLSKCPLSWFYRYGLSLYLPQDPEYDDDQWLDSTSRGSLLHAVFEQFAKMYLGRQQDLLLPQAKLDLLTVADFVIAEWREKVPPPGEAVFQREVRELHEAATTFLSMECHSLERGDLGKWLHLEYSFGGADAPGVYALDNNEALQLKGRADRIDELPDGTLRVIDYKTGSSARFAKNNKKGIFDGGRQLQPALYAAAYETLLGRPVSSFEYRFPTKKGESTIISYSSEELGDARPIIAKLIDHTKKGTFIATTDGAEDCKFCDYQTICRATTDNYNKVTSPRAAWAKEYAEDHPEYVDLIDRRTNKKVSSE